VVPEGYLSGGGGDRLRRRSHWQFGQPPDEFTVALARLRRLTEVCPGAEVPQHIEMPSQWAGTVPGVCDGDRPVLVTGRDLGELASAMELAVERRACLRTALDAIRVSWPDYQIWYIDQRWWALRRTAKASRCARRHRTGCTNCSPRTRRSARCDRDLLGNRVHQRSLKGPPQVHERPMGSRPDLPGLLMVWGLGIGERPGRQCGSCQASSGVWLPLQVSRYASLSSRASGKPCSPTARITSRARQ
jgi:hypothetical protein